MDVKIIPLWTEPIIRSIIYQIRHWNFLTFWLNQTAKRKQFLVIRRPMLHGKFKSQYTLSISSSFLLLLSPSLEKWETPRYHESKISESRQSFLIQPDGHFHFRTTDKKPMGCRSVPDHECNHAPKIHTYHFFSSHICRTKVCCDWKVLLPWQRDVTTSPLDF